MSDVIYKINEVEIHYVRDIKSYFDKVTSHDIAIHIFRDFIDSTRIDYKEFFWVMFVNRSHTVLGISEIGKGSTSSVVVNNKEIFQLALKLNATAIILCHNHPSGNLKPSQTDIKFTKRIVTFAQCIDVTILDHIIITSDDSYSFAENFLLPKAFEIY